LAAFHLLPKLVRKPLFWALTQHDRCAICACGGWPRDSVMVLMSINGCDSTPNPEHW
jgi:hypothetical protein